MLWSATASEAWNRLLLDASQPLRRMLLAQEVLDLIKKDPDKLWADALARASRPEQVVAVRTAVDSARPTLWIYWIRSTADGVPGLLDFRVE